MKIKHIINQKGFTLIEILIAIALFAALTAMLYPAYIGTFKNMDITESYGSVYRMARIAADRISDDLESACTPSMGGNSGSDIEKYQVFSGDQLSMGGRHMDTVQFLSEKHLSLNGDNILGRGVIKYYSKQFENEDGFTLYRSDYPELGDKSQEGAGGFAVCEGLNAIYFFYQDENGETYDRWDSTAAPFTGKLPSLVSVQLEFLNKSDPDKPIRFTTSIALPQEKKRYGSNS
jgi:prepilin-type N-terminal cleavage/methylation domain-containing protein